MAVAPSAPSASFLDLVLGLALGSAQSHSGNHVALEGLTVTPGADGALEIGVRRLAATSLRLASGPFTLELDQFALHQVQAVVRMEAGRPRLAALDAGSAELSGVKLQGPADLAGRSPGAPHTWTLGPLGAADGTLRAEIVDAHLVFDADVTVHLRQGQVDFNQATVEHVGPDSRMGVSRLGVYVDAPNGRSYLYQFPEATVAGVQYESRSALPGPWGGDRGRLQLQPFLETLLGQPSAAPALGITEQARALFDRTALSGDLQLADARFAAFGVQADTTGRAEGSNTIRLHSDAVGRGLSADMPSVAARDAVLTMGHAQWKADTVAGALRVRLTRQGADLRFALELASLKVSGLHLQPRG